MFKSDDNGESWDKLLDGGSNNFFTNNLNDVFFMDDEIGWVIGDGGLFEYTNDAGTSWNAADGDFPFTDDLTAFDFYLNNQAMIVGNSASSPVVAGFRDDNNHFSQRFWYDEMGRLVLSQDARLFAKDEFKGPHIYRYTLYDHLDRVVESGEWLMPKYDDEDQLQENERYLADDILLNATQIDYQSLLDMLALDQTGERTEVIQTYYDYEFSNFSPGFSISGFDQENVRNRVATMTREENHDGDHSTYDYAVHHSYDVHGKVKTIMQEQPALSSLGQQFKRVDYVYDIVSGNINEIHYQKGELDQLFHRYCYDADNRITSVLTSKNGFDWDQDAKYFYYLHGPKKRVEIGDLKVQAQDYAYTIHGWVKGVNSNTLTPDRDMGEDGKTGTTINQYSGRDQIGYTLGYYDGDYNDIGGLGTTTHFEADVNGSQFMADGQNLYNGNINHMVTAIRSFMSGTTSPQVMRYEYDQLDRLKTARSYADASIVSGNDWATSGISSWDYAVDLEYDANGNILSLDRSADGASAAGSMDQLEYYYYDESDLGYNRKTNRLKQVTDANSTYAGNEDIKPGQIARNYEYDGIGNLIFDDQEEIDEIKWTSYARIKEIIRKSGSTKVDIEYKYDGMYNRIVKIVKPKESNGDLKPQADWIYSYYFRDDLGNILATYELTNDGTDDFLRLTEQIIYGQVRCGVLSRNILLASSGSAILDDDRLQRGLHNKNYELNNQLGNILTTVDGRRIAQDDNTDNTIDYFTASVNSANDYYPFGMLMIGRKSNADKYRFGFQGEELDNEPKGNGNQIYFKYRIHDTRLGRFLSVDPLYKEYAYNSVYAFSENRLIDMIELEGAEIDVLPESVGNTLRSWENSMQSAWDDWGDWIDEHVVVEGSANASIGVQIGVKAKVGGVLEAEAGLNLGSYRIAGAKVDFINFEESTADADMFDGDGVTVTQSVSLAVTVPDTKFGLGVVATHSFNGYAEGGYDNESYDVKPYVGVNLAKKSFGPGSKNQSSSQTTTSSNATTFSASVVKPAAVKVDAKVQYSTKKDKTCFCLSLGVGAALGLSVDASLKIGLEF